MSSNSVGETVVVGWTDGREDEVVVVVVEVEGGGGISTIPSSSSSSSILPVSEVGVAVKNPTSMDMFPSGSAVGLGALVMMMMAIVGLGATVVVVGVGGTDKKSSPIDMLKLTSMSKGMGLVLLEDDLLLFEVDLEPLDDDLEDLPLLEDFLEHFAACCW